MRAVAITGDRTAALVDLDRPAPAAGEVLLDVSYCGICGPDLLMVGMPAGMLPPGHVLGHEFTAVIAELGPQADGWAVLTVRGAGRPQRRHNGGYQDPG